MQKILRITSPPYVTTVFQMNMVMLVGMNRRSSMPFLHLCLSFLLMGRREESVEQEC